MEEFSRIMLEILVVGLVRSDAGKTTLARALVEFYSRNWEASRVQGFKPMAANNFWFDYTVLARAMKKGRIYGKDAKLLHEASSDSPGIEAINPVHRVWGVRDRGTEAFLLDRIFPPKGDSCLVVNSEEKLPERMERFVSDWSAEKMQVDGIQDVDSLMESHYYPARRSALNKLKSKNDILIVESYADVTLPMDGLEPKSVIGVAPGYAYEFLPSKFMEANRFVQGTYMEVGRREVLMKRIEDLVRPRSKVEIPVLPEEIRKDQGALLRAYSKSLNQLNLPEV